MKKVTRIQGDGETRCNKQNKNSSLCYFVTSLLRYSKSERGQSFIEAILVFCILLLPVTFALIQMATITYSYLVAHEAAFMGVRCAVVQDSEGNAENAAKFASPLVLFTAGTRDILPDPSKGGGTGVTLWSKDPLGKGGKDDANQKVVMFSVHQYYLHRIFFCNLLQFPPLPIMKLATHARMIRSPDKLYLKKAYPGAPEW